LSQLTAVPLLAGLLGCGADNGLTLGQVRGTVTYEGQPVKYGQVMFVPDDSKGTTGPVALSMINKDGTFDMSTEEAGDGVVVGQHKVGIVGLDPTPIANSEPPKDEGGQVNVMKAKAKAATQRVSKGQGDTFTDRGGRTFRYVTPKRLGQAETSGLTIRIERGSNTIHFNVRQDGTVEIQ